MFRQNYVILVLTTPEKQIRILGVELDKISGQFYFSVRSILPCVKKIYLLVCARRFNSDCLFFWGGGWRGRIGCLTSYFLFYCVFLFAVFETLVVFLPRYTTHTQIHALHW